MAGFILAIIAAFIGWFAPLGYIIWSLGIIFSAIGTLKKPRIFAISGIFISIIDIFIVYVLYILAL